MAQQQFSTQRLDHLGIVAGFCNKLGLIEIIDEKIGRGEKLVSHGETTQAMVLNAMGFVSRPLYLTPEFFENKPLDRLIRPGIEAVHLNANSLGRTLDALFEAGVTEVFAEIAQKAVSDFGVSTPFVHLDTTSFSFTGEYLAEGSVDPGTDPGGEAEKADPIELDEDRSRPVRITYGHSKDRRPDLKQMVLSLIVAHRSTIPLWIEALDGNTSDKKSFPSTIEKFCKQMEGAEPVIVADSALYTAKNLCDLSEQRFVTRVPDTIQLARDLYAKDPDEDDWTVTEDKRYRYCSFSRTYGGVDQRWFLIHSEDRFHHQEKLFFKNQEKRRVRAEKALKKLCLEEFSCPSDAEQAAAKVVATWPSHLAKTEVTEHAHYSRRGRPRADQKPDRVSFRISGTIHDDADHIANQRRRWGHFVVATNELSEERLPGTEVVALYRNQGVTVERGFRFLKDPLFFAHGVYLHKPSRVMALLMVMTLSLLIYSLAERHLRSEMASRKHPLPDQKGKLTYSLTLRRVFQMFEGIDVLRADIGGAHHVQVLNMTRLRWEVLELLGPEAKCIYGPG